MRRPGNRETAGQEFFEKSYGKIPVGSLSVGEIREEDFINFLTENLGEIKESSLKTYVKHLRRVLLFAKEKGYTLRGIVEEPEKFFLEFARSKGFDEQRMRAPRSIFFRYVLPFLRYEVERGKELSGEVLFPEKGETKKRKRGEKIVAVKDTRTPPPEIDLIEKLFEEREKEMEKKLSSILEEIRRTCKPETIFQLPPVEEFRSMSFPCIILFMMPGQKTPLHIVALEKIAEDRHILKVRGFIVERWAEDIIAFEKTKRREMSAEGKRPQPPIESYGIPKREIVFFKEIEEGVHEPNAVLKEVEPLLRKLIRGMKSPAHYEEKETATTMVSYL